MEANTQPILCCLGGSVAGNPTQFVLERALAEAELDWRVITVEVDNRDLSLALQGVRAMKFSAVQFLEPLRGQIAEQMFPNDPSLRFIGEVSSASRNTEGWLGWNSSGPGILRAASEKGFITASESVPFCCLLIGDSPRLRSTAVALKLLPAANVIWLTAENTDTREVSFAAEGEAYLKFTEDTEHVQDWLDSVDGAADQLLVVAESYPDMSLVSRIISNFCGSRCYLFAEPQHIPSAPHEGLFLLSEADQAVAALAEDFEAWTGLPAETSLMRDAYDEYCDF